MSSVINTNIASLNAQRNLTSSQASLTTALQRLSSGLRINSAKDDAAGLAIANRFTTQINGLNQAVRNANDGISLAQTGDAALSEITNNLQRIRELSVQAANSTNSSSDRAAINLEVQQRLAEIDRTASTTSFNGQKLFDGNFGTANFQVGANAGEAIGINLSTNMRNTATGQIASATAGTLGAAGALNGHVATANVTAFDFSAAGSTATAGKLTFDVATSNFQGATGAIDGTSNQQSVVNGVNFSTAGSPQVDANTTVGSVTTFDYSAANLAQFDVNIAGSTTGTVSVNLDQNYGSGNAVAAAIQSQIQATAGNENVAVTFSGGTYTFTNTGKQGAGNAVTITNADANAKIGTADFSTNTVNNGSPAVASSQASLTIDGTNITLSSNDANKAAIAAELTTKMQASALGANYSAAIDGGGKLVITHAGSATAVAITNVDANAAAAGFANTSGVAGAAASSGNAVSLDIDGHSVTLNANYGNDDGVAAAIGAQLGGSYTAVNNSGTITVARTVTGAGSSSIAQANVTGNGSASLSNFASTAGTAGTPTSNATFYVDGNAVTLTANDNNMAGLAADVQTKLQAIDSNYTAVAGNGTNGGAAGQLVISKAGMTAVNITGADANATAAGLGFKNGVAGTAAGTITLSNFSINGISLNGTYAASGSSTAVDQLAAAINSGVGGVYASNAGGSLKITSSSAIALTGADATGATGFNTASVAANSGSLSQINVSTVAGANDAIQRVDSALTSVSNLQSTFGAIENRFDSVINSLSTTSENLTSARSRIQDADFAAETAAMTRGQILQQAGTAMLAQANSLPNGVLALLRG